MSKKKRISVDLSDTTIKILRLQAQADGRVLKNYVEKMLNGIANKKAKKTEDVSK